MRFFQKHNSSRVRQHPVARAIGLLVLVTSLPAIPLLAVPAQMPWATSGTGGAHLLAGPGELEIQVFKRNVTARGSELRATLFGPDRKPLAEVRLPSAGEKQTESPAPAQTKTLRTKVDRPGIYMLMITTPGDRHGLNVEWALQTNASAWVVETSRGHRDDRHREPIVMLDAERSADVTFLPRTGAFEIEIEALPPDADPPILYDADGEMVARIPVTQKQSVSIRAYMRVPHPARAEASASFTVPADETRGDRPWRLHLPQGRFFLEIDGLTRWGKTDLYSDHNIWSPVAGSWFPFQEHRWLISPAQRTVYATPGNQGKMIFVLHNNSLRERTTDLSLEFPEERWNAELSDKSFTLAPRDSTEIEVTFTAPGDGRERVVHIRATPRETPEITNYATLKVHGGESPAEDPLNLPHVLEPFAHENRQFGYLPDYPLDNQIYFDLENRGFVVAENLLHRQVEVDGEWTTTDLSQAVVRSVPEIEADDWSSRGTKVAFDSANNIYLLGGTGRSIALLRSTDGGETFTAYIIAGREREHRSWDIEQFSGHNVPPGPPAVTRLTRTPREDENIPIARRDPRVRWRNMNDLELFVADETADGDIAFHEPVKLSDHALGTAMHSGIPSMIVSRGSKIHVAWGEATDPDAERDEIPGVPAYVATYDRDTRELGEPVFMSFGPPPNDVHNTPSITMDSKGHLHVVVGTHGRPFQYLRSLEPNDAYSGWTEAIRTSEEELRQTYVGLVCDDQDALHLVFRLWMSDTEHLDGGLWPALAHQRKPKGGDWEEAKILVAPPLADYGIYYHRLTVDRHGAVFLNYDYWSTSWFYRNDGRGPVAAGSGRPGTGWGRSLITSPDSGATWKLW